eukprot:5636231-Amphidinium_carterae.1
MMKAQLARAHEYTLDEALLKIEGTRNRVQQIVENRDRAAKRRMIMVTQLMRRVLSPSYPSTIWPSKSQP